MPTELNIGHEITSNGPDLSVLVKGLIDTQTTLTGREPQFQYGLLGQNEREQLESILERTQRARIWMGGEDGHLELPPVESRENLKQHAVDLLQTGRALQEFSLQRAQASGNANYFGLARQIDWEQYGDAAVFHDIGEGNPKGDWPRSVIPKMGMEFYESHRAEHAAAEEAYVHDTVLGDILKDSPHKGAVGRLIDRYENRQETDVTFQILHVVDKIRGIVQATLIGTQDSKDGRQSGFDSAFRSIKLLASSLSPESLTELTLFILNQLDQVPDKPEAKDQLRDILATALPQIPFEMNTLTASAEIAQAVQTTEPITRARRGWKNRFTLPRLRQSEPNVQPEIKAKPKEIERKYAMARFTEEEFKLFEAQGYVSEEVWQGYVSINPDGSEDRIRQKGGKYIRTQKAGKGVIRDEVNTPMETEDFFALLPEVRGRIVQKRRYQVPLELGYALPSGATSLTIELDMYTGDLSAGQTMEIEFASPEDEIKFRENPPIWMTETYGVKDVTDDKRYKNQQIALHGIPAIIAI